MKSKVLKLLMCFAIFSIIVSQFNFTSLIAAENSLEFNFQSDKDREAFVNKKYDYQTVFRLATLGSNAAYCLDYGKKIPNASSLTYKGDLSAEALAVLVYGYSNNSLSEFGIADSRENEIKYLVTQMALWEVVTKTGESERGLDFNIDDASASPGYEENLNEVKTAARKLSEKAMKNPYNPKTEIKIDTTNFDIVEKGDLRVAGPYKVKTSDSAEKIHDIKATLSSSAPANSYIADKFLNAKNNFSLNEDIYVVSKKSDQQASFNLNVEVAVEKLKCGVYRATNESSVQDFVTLVNDTINVEESVSVTWKKDTGNITIIKEDQNGNKIKDVRFEILDSSSNKVAEAVTNSSGKIELINMPTGQYYVREISAPSEYEFDASKKSVVVTSGNTSTLEITNTKSNGSLVVVKKDDNGDVIPNVTFKILDSNKNKIQTITTNNNGIAQSKTLSVGTYYLVETDVPDNIVLDATEHKIKITSTTQTVTKNLENETVKGSLKITVNDEFGEPLSGVKFEIYNSNGKKIETITSNNSGIALSSILAPGDYSYKQVSTKDDNLIFDTTLRNFTVTNSGNIVVKKEVNPYKKGNIKITKVDQNNNPIEGVTFKIYDSNKKLIDTIATNKSGIAIGHSNMVLGTYYYKEVSAPDNVEINSEEKSFELKTEGKIVEVSLKNNIISGKIKIIKVDEKNNPIEGVTFEILDSNKQVIQTITTDELGFAISNQLSKGTYYYREKETLPQYVLDNTEHEFKIQSDTDFVSETVVNKLKSARLVINKQNKDTGLALQNIRFEILDANKNIIQSIVTDENGRAESEELTLGTYYYKEVSVPENIAIDNNEYEFEIVDSYDNVEKTIYNVQKRLPVTGSFFSTNVVIVIIVSISTILVYVIVKMIIAYVQNKRYGNNNWY